MIYQSSLLNGRQGSLKRLEPAPTHRYCWRGNHFLQKGRKGKQDGDVGNENTGETQLDTESDNNTAPACDQAKSSAPREDQTSLSTEAKIE